MGTKTVPVKKISTETCIKFESKKEKKTSETENQENEEQQSERRQLVRVSRSIEGPAPQSKSAKEKKSGSTMSLQKIFIDGPNSSSNRPRRSFTRCRRKPCVK